MIESLPEQQARLRRELILTLKQSYPHEDPIERMRSPGWVLDLKKWAQLGRRR